MTTREFLNAVAAGTMTDEIMGEAQARLEKLDAQNAARASKPTKRQQENAPLMARIMEILPVEGMVATQVGEAIGITTQKASGLLRALENSGEVTSFEVKYNKRKAKAYRPAASDTVITVPGNLAAE